jgi:hypothetical protein
MKQALKQHAAALLALECLEAGDWNHAHALLQNDLSPEAAWVHAHLHRAEGDLSNARYWYSVARRPECTQVLDDERREVTRMLSEILTPFASACDRPREFNRTDASLCRPARLEQLPHHVIPIRANVSAA